MSPTRPVTDRALARRLERAEACANAAFVEARAAYEPASAATWRDFDGTYAMFDGIGSPVTQTFGLGLFASSSNHAIETIEAFFSSRGADVNHEVCPLADPALLTLLPAHGYRPIELSTVLHQSIEGLQASIDTGARAATARPIGDPERALWARVSAAGWGSVAGLDAFMTDFGHVSARSRGTTCFLAHLDGVVVATGALAIHDGVALLAGASTLQEWRGRGAQTALLAARLAYAADAGCDLAMMAAAPGSTSQTNAERQGFRIAYTRTKWAGRGAMEAMNTRE